MKVKNTTPFLVGSKATSRTPPDPEMVMVVRASYSFSPHAPPAVIEGIDQGFLTAEVFREDDEDGSGTPLYPGDFADFKPAADVMIRGTCHVPGATPTRECEVGFSIGPIDKTLVVSGPRPWSGPPRRLFGAPGPAEPFTTQPLDYDYAYGGVGDERNPAGTGIRGTPVPHVESPSERLGRWRRPQGLAGFGPINSRWPSRARLVGRNYKKKYLRERAPYFSDDFDWTHFQSAPPDQRIQGYLNGDETLTLRNLHPETSELSIQLPGIRVRVFVRDDEERFREVTMRLDTLYVDADEQKLVLTWRGLDPVRESDFSDVKSAMVISESLADSPRPAAEFEPVLIEFEQMRPGFDQLDDEVREQIEAAEAAAEEATKGKPDGEPPDLAALLAPARAFVDNDKLDATLALVDDVVDKTSEPGMPVNAGDMLGQILQEIGNVPAQAAPIAAGQVPRVPLAKQLNQAVEMAEKAAAAAREVGSEAHGLAEMYEQLQNPALALLDPAFVPPKNPATTDEEAKAAGEAPELDPNEDLRDQDLRARDFTNADLQNADFSNSDLSGVSLAGANLTNATMTGAKLVDADLTGARFSRATLVQVDATNAKFDQAHLHQTAIVEATLTGASFAGAEGFQASFVASNCSGANFAGSQLNQCDFSNANLTDADLSNADLSRSIFLEVSAASARFDGAQISMSTFLKADLSDASFVGAGGNRMSFHDAKADRVDFSRAVFHHTLFFNTSAREANFTHADLRGARLNRACLVDAELFEMNLFEADLSNADLEGARLDGSNLYGALLNETNLDQVELRSVDLKHAVQIPA